MLQSIITIIQLHSALMTGQKEVNTARALCPLAVSGMKKPCKRVCAFLGYSALWRRQATNTCCFLWQYTQLISIFILYLRLYLFFLFFWKSFITFKNWTRSKTVVPKSHGLNKDAFERGALHQPVSAPPSTRQPNMLFWSHLRFLQSILFPNPSRSFTINLNGSMTLIFLNQSPY